MISNYEFIKTQSFEVAWALFRCAELFSQADLRKNVEAAAIELLSGYDAIGGEGEIEFPLIEKTISLVRLAESVGQIAPINANVLYRELDNLAKAMHREVADRKEKRGGALALDAMFSNAAYAKGLATSPDVSAMAAPSGAPDRTSIGQSAEQGKAVTFGNIESLLSAATQSSSMQAGSAVLPQESSAGVASGTLGAFLQSPAPATLARQEVPGSAGSLQAGLADSLQASPVSQLRTSSASPMAGSWQHVILQKVKELNQTTTKELAANFPEISERTIRFYLQKLVDGGLIDRIGSSGPGAAYKSRN